MNAMNLFFQRSHTYVVNRPIDQVKNRLTWIVTRRWDDFSMDLVGRLQQDGEFSLTKKFGLTSLEWIDDTPAYIRGTLDGKESGTNIRIVTEPNRYMVSFFYLLMGLFLVELLEWETMIPLEKNLKIGILAATCGLLLVVMYLFSNNIRKRFEQLMQL